MSVLDVNSGGMLDSRSVRSQHVPSSWAALVTILNCLQPVLKLERPTPRRTSDAAKDLIDLAMGTAVSMPGRVF